MAGYFFQNQILQIILFQAIVLFILLTNTWLIHSARSHAPPERFPIVSILVPARNEEKKIRGCIQSLLAQDYPSFEVIALDDQSNDSTRLILEEIASSQPALVVLSGSATPEGHSGKNWACAQLARQAKGDLLFFTDADTLHQPNTLQAVVAAFMGEHADMLTGFPRQEMRSWGERLLVPFFSWISLCFNPLGLAYRFRLPALSSAVGQMMLFRREAYLEIGGHDLLGSSAVDDLKLARRIKISGLRWRVAYITDLVACRMYDGSRQAFNGFSNNFFADFDFHLLPYIFAFGWLVVMFWKPLILIAQLAFKGATQVLLLELTVCVGLSLLIWLISYIVLKVPPGLALLYPITILAVEFVAMRSLWLSFTGRLEWKERSLSSPRWKWF